MVRSRCAVAPRIAHSRCTAALVLSACGTGCDEPPDNPLRRRPQPAASPAGVEPRRGKPSAASASRLTERRPGQPGGTIYMLTAR